MQFFNKYLLFILSALLVTLYASLGGGMFPSQLRWWIPWYTLVMLEVLLIFPEMKRTETLVDARRRVWRGVFRDPLFYIGILLCGYLVIQWQNYCSIDSEKVYIYSKELGKWIIPSPRWLGLPWCVVKGEGRSVLDWFPPVLTLALVVRHGLLKPTKRMLGTFVCWLAAILAILGIIQFIMESQFLFFGLEVESIVFSTFGYPNIAASFFPFIMLLSIGQFLWSLEHRTLIRVKPWLYLIPATLCCISGVLTLSRAGVIFSLILPIISMLYIMFRYFGGWGWPMRIRVVVILVVTILIGIMAIQLPKDLPIRDEIIETDWAAFAENPIAVRASYQAPCAWEMYEDHSAFGVGAWGFSWHIYQYVKPEDRAKAKGVGQANVHNDFLQFLTEHGWVGMSLMGGCILSLLLPFLWQLLKSPRQTASNRQADRCWLNRINVMYVFCIMAVLMMVLHSVVDVIFRSPACMAIWVIALTMAPGFIITLPPTTPRKGIDSNA